MANDKTAASAYKNWTKPYIDVVSTYNYVYSYCFWWAFSLTDRSWTIIHGSFSQTGNKWAWCDAVWWINSLSAHVWRHTVVWAALEIMWTSERSGNEVCHVPFSSGFIISLIIKLDSEIFHAHLASSAQSESTFPNSYTPQSYTYIMLFCETSQII